MRIAYLAHPTMVNGIYRSLWPMECLTTRGHEVRRLPHDRARESLAAVREIDALHIHRYVERRVAQPLIETAKEHGAAVVWDDDDDLATVPERYRRRESAHWERHRADLHAVLRLVDLATAPNRLLAERFREYGAARTRTLENCLPAWLLRPHRPSASRVTIGWVAGLEHRTDAEQLGIRAVLQDLLDRHPDVHVVSVGLGLGLRGDRYEHLEKVPIGHLTDQTRRFDIGIAPLADTPFNRCKSNVKLKEYAAGGAAWLASPVGPYADMPESAGGRLVADDRWHAELTRLVERPRERRKLAKRAAKWVAGETIERNIGAWEAAFADAREHGRAAA